MKNLTKKEEAELRRLDRKIGSGVAVTRKQILRAIELKNRKSDAKKAAARDAA